MKGGHELWTISAISSESKIISKQSIFFFLKNHFVRAKLSSATEQNCERIYCMVLSSGMYLFQAKGEAPQLPHRD